MSVSRNGQLTVLSGGLYHSEILTDRVRTFVEETEVRNGIVNLLLQHTTSALLLVEHEAGIMMDLRETLERIAPSGAEYHHHRRGVDTNGAGHMLSALLNKTLSIPVVDGTIALGTYQEILFMDFQSEETERTITITVCGEVT